MKEHRDHAEGRIAMATGIFFIAMPVSVLLLLAGHLAEGALLLVVALAGGVHLVKKGKLGAWRDYLL